MKEDVQPSGGSRLLSRSSHLAAKVMTRIVRPCALIKTRGPEPHRSRQNGGLSVMADGTHSRTRVSLDSPQHFYATPPLQSIA